MAKADQARALAETGAAWTRERVADLRDAGGYVQAKVALVALYVVLVAVTAIMARPEPVLATAQRGSIPFGLVNRHFVRVTNVELGDLEMVWLEASGYEIDFDSQRRASKWRHTRQTFNEGETIELWPEDFSDRDNSHPGNGMVIEHIDIIVGGDRLVSLPTEDLDAVDE